MSQSDLDLASVVFITTRHQKWKPLQDDEPLALLHSKFWGKSLIFEDPPRRNQPHASPHGSELGDESQRMDVDNSDDVIPGPSILNIGIDRLPFSTLFIRADYIRVYDFLDKLEVIRFPNGLAPAAVLTGHPGTGKLPLSIQQAEYVYSYMHDARREECLGVLCHMLTPCRQEGGHLVSRPHLLSIRQRRCLRSSSKFSVVLLLDFHLDPHGF